MVSFWRTSFIFHSSCMLRSCWSKANDIVTRFRGPSPCSSTRVTSNTQSQCQSQYLGQSDLSHSRMWRIGSREEALEKPLHVCSKYMTAPIKLGGPKHKTKDTTDWKELLSGPESKTKVSRSTVILKIAIFRRFCMTDELNGQALAVHHTKPYTLSYHFQSDGTSRYFGLWLWKLVQLLNLVWHKLLSSGVFYRRLS